MKELKPVELKTEEQNIARVNHRVNHYQIIHQKKMIMYLWIRKISLLIM
jgi:hypothetical protein